ncbi:YnhF family membrane protein [Vibrio sp. ZSDE26]|uniref:YnhF family membrane protein n=1 Tax=Vibrio amylolyticus TaxID=2847292 RepID=A0A9X2BFU4_9VIBR|nr:YnhF family membrane protein [Vibrio amylolyticus]MCK6262084.1 YnhF family membrane protein [Vibrio amylolyticus]
MEQDLKYSLLITAIILGVLAGFGAIVITH